MHVRSSHLSRVRINRLRLPILLVVAAEQEKNFSLSPFAPENFISRNGFGSPVPRQPAHRQTLADSGAYLWDFSQVLRRRPFIYLNGYTSFNSLKVPLVNADCSAVQDTCIVPVVPERTTRALLIRIVKVFPSRASSHAAQRQAMNVLCM